MRKIIMYMQMTVDGFASGSNGEMDWLTVSAETWSFVEELLSTVDTALIGRATYQQFESFWPAAGKDPSSSAGEVEHSEWLERTQKVVFSRSLKSVDWVNSTLARDIAETVAALKQQPGGDMVLLGGIGLAQSFTKQRLIDEYRILVNPHILGAGVPLFGNVGDLPLKLKGSKTLESGVLALIYGLA